jgi:hypothetical protein
MFRQLRAKGLEAYGLMRLGDSCVFPPGFDSDDAAGNRP